MPCYDFQTPDGRVVEQVMAMGDAPAIGDTIELDGETLTRLPSAATTVQEGFRPYTAFSLGRQKVPGVPNDDRGYLAPSSKKHERLIARHTGRHWK